jgi:arylsulfatase A-like enzyme
MKPSHGHDQTIVNGISRIGYMSGGTAARWNDENMSDEFVGRAVGFLERHRDRRFFLYFALHDPHVPRVPHPRFVGKTALGPRGDAIVQADAAVGSILAALDRLNLTQQTLVLVTSDNGAVVDDGYRDDAVEKLGTHRPNGPWRGGKYSKFEGGTRVPLVVRWPGRVKPGESAALFSQIDLLASLAALVGQTPDPAASPDSQNHLQALLGDSPTGRESLVEQGQGLALRHGVWKFIPANEGSPVAWQTGNETANAPSPQLYRLDLDPGETNNLATREPERLNTLRQTLSTLRERPKPAP